MGLAQTTSAAILTQLHRLNNDKKCVCKKPLSFLRSKAKPLKFHLKQHNIELNQALLALIVILRIIQKIPAQTNQRSGLNI